MPAWRLFGEDGRLYSARLHYVNRGLPGLRLSAPRFTFALHFVEDLLTSRAVLLVINQTLRFKLGKPFKPLFNRSRLTSGVWILVNESSSGASCINVVHKGNLVKDRDTSLPSSKVRLGSSDSKSSFPQICIRRIRFERRKRRLVCRPGRIQLPLLLVGRSH